jgi:hypothetical protein
LITATYRYHIDWDGDNSFVLPVEDISAFVFEATWEYGRDYASQLNGRSVWNDGNDTPSIVTEFIDTEDPALADAGPPADWAVEVIKGIANGTARVQAFF